MENILFEDIRNRYLPTEIKVLFIGESPPCKGQFFYSGKPKLLTSTMEVFEDFFKKDFKDNLEFLKFFKTSDYFLDDLCHKPINQIEDPIERNKKRSKSVKALRNRLKEYNPKKIIVIMKDKDFNKYINQAINLANLNNNIRYEALPFPRYERDVIRYKLGLKEYLADLRSKKTIH